MKKAIELGPTTHCVRALHQSELFLSLSPPLSLSAVTFRPPFTTASVQVLKVNRENKIEREGNSESYRFGGQRASL
jgi:hypothetical protein